VNASVLSSFFNIAFLSISGSVRKSLPLRNSKSNAIKTHLSEIRQIQRHEQFLNPASCIVFTDAEHTGDEG